MTCQAMDAERDEAEDFLLRHGYRRCDIPACNCGSWHGGHANDRLYELREAFAENDYTNANGKTLLTLVRETLAERDALRAALAELVERVDNTPLADGSCIDTSREHAILE